MICGCSFVWPRLKSSTIAVFFSALSASTFKRDQSDSSATNNNTSPHIFCHDDDVALVQQPSHSVVLQPTPFFVMQGIVQRRASDLGTRLRMSRGAFDGAALAAAVASERSGARSMLQERLDDVLVLELLKDGGRNYLTLSVRSL
mmetsp:Transcript_5059/g.14146  ORF Transcript_5059/g.14146 Transcript_5059/m.14146 type:complete len:145 (-) Transcript_5059:2235-2669(-)